MAVTETSHTADGSKTQFAFTFPYLKTTDIEVQVDGTVESTSNWSLANATTVQFNSAPTSGKKIKILRQTNVDSLTATFYAGSSIKSEDLNDNYTQNLYKTQEIGNRSFQNTGTSTMIGDLQMGEDTKLVFEGATDDAYETSLTVADPTADRTITLPNVTGTVVTTGDTGTVTATMLAANSVDSSELVDGSIDTSHIADAQVTTAKIAADAVNGTKIADDSIDSEHIADGSIDTAHIADSQVTTAKLANTSVTTGKIAADAIDGTKIADDSINSEHYVDGSIDAAHIADLNITTAKIAADAVTAAKLADNAVVTANITDANVTTAKIAADAITGAKIADDAIDSEHLVDGSIDTAHLSADCIDGTKIVDDAIGAEHIAANAVTSSEIADAELTTLAGMQAGTASILAGGTALTATLSELNLLDGKSVVTSVSGSSTDVQLPTAKAVNDQIVALIQDIGGFVPIANEVSFPNANPDPNNDAGTIVSIADAGGVVVNGSGVSTTGRTLGGSTVTINGIDSTLHSTTIGAGKGMLVQTTSTLNTYDYHRLIVDEAGVASAQTLVTDFNQRYQVASSTPSQQPDGTALAEGDLWFDTGNDKMKVYSGSQYDQVTSIGDYKLLTVVNDGQTSGSPTFNGSIVSYDLRDDTGAASVTSPGQLIVSLNGVIQKPNTGSYDAAEEGYFLEGTNGIKFATAPPSGSSLFITLIGSATTINVPGDNSVSSAKIQAGAVATAKIENNAVDLTKMVHGTQGGIVYYAASGTPTELAAGTSGYYLKTQGSGANPVWAEVSTTPTTTRGDIIYRAASADARLAKGTAGQFLKIGANDPEWADVPSGVTGGGTNKVFLEFEKTIDYNYTITNNHNALTAGPVTIAATGNGDSSAVVVTVGDGETWTIV